MRVCLLTCTPHITGGPGSLRYDIRYRRARSAEVGNAYVRAEVALIRYFVIRLVGVTVLVGTIGEIENVSQVFHPNGRLAASNSP